jgi:frataxin-like iron-binding protein CyaY
MKWVNSAGGPLLFLNENHLSIWSGAIGDPQSQSDYYRACLIDDLIGSINVGEGLGIILNDSPMQTTWLPSKINGQGYLIRWKYAKNESSVIQYLEEIPQSIFHSENITFTASCARIILFDAALSGITYSKGEFLEIIMDIGDHQIETGIFEPDSETSLVIHKFFIRN